MSPPTKISQIHNEETRQLFSDSDPYQLYDEWQSVGHGNFGTVYYARDKETQQVVAIKKINYMIDKKDCKTEETWQMVVKEVTVMHRCNHPNLVKYFNCFLRAPDVYLVMEYCLGSAADILVVNDSFLEEDEIGAICHQTLLGLHYLHERNFIHRDVKACNILLQDNGQVKLGDFGTISFTASAKTFVGTPYWMAPEVITAVEENEYTGLIDIWSLGICCYEFTTGYPPNHNMHIMAALFHIRFNKPKMDLPQFDKYSDNFRKFMAQCFLDHDQRPSARYLLDHDPFIVTPRQPNVLPDLLKQTVEQVITQNSKGKLRGKEKLLLNAPNGTPDTPGTPSSTPDTPGDSTGGSLDHVYKNLEVDASDSSPAAVKPDERRGSSSGSQQQQAPPFSGPASQTPVKVTNGQGAVTPGGGGGKPVHTPSSAPSHSIQSPIVSLSPTRDHRGMMVGGGGHTQTRIATIKTQHIVQQEERSRNELREQMSGYKEMRRDHQKQIQTLEQRNKIEMKALQEKIERDYADYRSKNLKDETKYKANSAARIAAKEKAHEKQLKTLIDQLKETQTSERKSFAALQKKERKKRLDDFKHNQPGGATRDQVGRLQQQMELEQASELELLQSQQQDKFKQEILALKQRQYNEICSLETEILNEELQRKSVEQDLHNRMCVRHHEEMSELERQHLDKVQDLRQRLMEEQHEIELKNHHRFEQETMRELDKKRLDSESRQPKIIRERHSEIKRQMAGALQVQEKSLKQYQQKLLEEAPRDQHKDIIRRINAELEEKRAKTHEIYSQAMENVTQINKDNLSAAMQKEYIDRKTELANDLMTLQNYQCQVKLQADQQRIKEKQMLDKKIDSRLHKFTDSMRQQGEQFAAEKERKERELAEKHEARRQDMLRERDHMERTPDMTPRGGSGSAHHTPQSGSSNRLSRVFSPVTAMETPPPPMQRTSSIAQSAQQQQRTSVSSLSSSMDGTHLSSSSRPTTADSSYNNSPVFLPHGPHPAAAGYREAATGAGSGTRL